MATRTTPDTTSSCCGVPLREDHDGLYCSSCEDRVDVDGFPVEPTRAEIRERMDEERFDVMRDEGLI